MKKAIEFGVMFRTSVLPNEEIIGIGDVETISTGLYFVPIPTESRSGVSYSDLHQYELEILDVLKSEITDFTYADGGLAVISRANGSVIDAVFIDD